MQQIVYNFNYYKTFLKGSTDGTTKYLAEVASIKYSGFSTNLSCECAIAPEASETVSKCYQ